MYYRLCLVVGIVLLASCAQQGSKRPGAPVDVAEIQAKDVPITLSALGRLKAKDSIRVISEVHGTIIAAPVSSGSYVEAGDILFQIDSGAFKIKADRARASLAQAQAALDFIRKKKERYSTLTDKEYIEKIAVDEIERELQSQEAQVKAAEAELTLAEGDIEDCDVRAKIAGILRDKKPPVGGVVNPGDTLAEIVQFNQLKVNFPIPEIHLGALQEAREQKPELPIEVWTRGGQHAIGHLTRVDPAVDPSTGTVEAKGIIDNPNRYMKGGQFARVKLTLRTEKEATVVPQSAVRIGQKGHYLYTISKDKKAQLHPVTVTFQTDTEMVLKEKFPSETLVVTEGQLNLFPGAPVSVRGKR